MHAELIPAPPVKPPGTVILTMSEDEATMLSNFAWYNSADRFEAWRTTFGPGDCLNAASNNELSQLFINIRSVLADL